MRRLLVLGAGTAGTMVANRLRRRLPRDEWWITVVDRDDDHPYQPSYLFVPFGRYSTAQVTKPRHSLLAHGVEFLLGAVDRVEPEHSLVRLVDGRLLDYDYLIIATGVSPRPDQTPGMLGPLWRQSIHDFFTLDGAQALQKALSDFGAGQVVVHVAEMPIKCPVAPLELTFLIESWARHTGIRDRVTITYVTPLSAAFTQAVASDRLGAMLDRRGIRVETDFMVERVDQDARTLVSYDGREVDFDLLVTVPVNMGADFVGRSGLGDELNCVPVDPATLQSRRHLNIFAIGDASDIPTSKAGSVAHFAVDSFVRNFVDLAHGRPMRHSFDGHANCFIESGDAKAMLVDFNYETEPLPGTYPVPGLGPFHLLKETRTNHLGKLAFRWLYWHVLLPGRPLPLPARMTLWGKKHPEGKAHVHDHA